MGNPTRPFLSRKLLSSLWNCKRKSLLHIILTGVLFFYLYFDVDLLSMFWYVLKTVSTKNCNVPAYTRYSIHIVYTTSFNLICVDKINTFILTRLLGIMSSWYDNALYFPLLIIQLSSFWNCLRTPEKHWKYSASNTVQYN